MYESYFGLKQKAFNLTPDPDFLYLNERTKEAFDEILYGIERRDGFAVVVGDVGTGKTTLSCALLQKIEGETNIRTVLIQNPMLPEVDLLKSILQDLGVTQAADWPEDAPEVYREPTKKELIDLLNTYLAERARENVFTVLIVDESQNLSLETLEQLRLLSNLETTKKKLLQIIFLGQLEFDRKLASLKQLDQRVSFRFETQALSREDCEKYIRHRLQIAGGAHAIRFGDGALRAIHRYSKGYPRLINVICDRSLREAWKERASTVTRQIVDQAAIGVARKEDLARRTRAKQIRVAACLSLCVAVAVLGGLFWSGRREQPVRPDPAAQITVESPPTQPAVLRATPPLPTVAKQAVQPGRVEYALQVYSFRTSYKAEESAGELRGMRFPSFVVHQPGEADDGWYVVYVGPFGDADTARRKGSDLQAATGAMPVLRERVAGQTKESTQPK
jgi:general secretion pathway protein A